MLTSIKATSQYPLPHLQKQIVHIRGVNSSETYVANSEGPRFYQKDLAIKHLALGPGDLQSPGC